MRRIALNIVSSLALMFTFSFVVVNTAYACSGGGSPGGAFPFDAITSYSQDQIIAIGEVSAAGNSEINVILTVDHYLHEPQTKGILLMKQEPLTYIYNSLIEGRRYPFNCIYLSPKIEVGRQFIAGLYHNEDGTYDGLILTADENGIFNFRFEDQPDVTRTFTTSELLAYVETLLETKAVEPEQYTSPRPVIVSLFTQTGETYLLPVDQSVPFLSESPSEFPCSLFRDDNNCTITLVAPNGLDRVSFYPIGSGIEERSTVDHGYNHYVEGKTGVFSHDSDFIAAWTADKLRVFAMGYDYVNEVANFTASPDDPLLAGAGAWSPNGRIFAFSTESGVWLWDAFTPDAQPTLLVSATDQPIRVRHYSPLGNYLALEDGTRRYYLDVISGLERPDGVFSPNDRLLAAYDTAAIGLTSLTLATFGAGYSPQITQFEWITPSKYLYAACGEPFFGEWSEGFQEPWCKVFINRINYTPDWIDGTAFDYDPITESLGVVVDADTVWINGEVIELSGLIDGDIVRLELVPLIDLNHELLP